MEPRIRALYEFDSGRTYEPALLEDGFFKASLDGRDGTSLIEIKYAGKKDWECAKAGKIPEKYYPQVQHGLMVSRLERGFFVAYLFHKQDPKILSLEHLAVVECVPNIQYIETLHKQEKEFWNEVLNLRGLRQNPAPIESR